MRVLVLLLALAAPVSAAPTIDNADDLDRRLHFHLDGLQDFPITTGAVPASHATEPPRTLATHSVACHAPADQIPFRAYHTYYGVSSVSRVEYNDGPHYFREPAVPSTFDILGHDGLDWYLIVQEPATQLPVAVPQVIVRATMREGADISLGDEGYNTGKIIAQGQTRPATLTPLLDHDQVTHHAVDGKHIYHFRVPMELEAAHVEGAYNVRIDVYTDVPTCDAQDKIMPNLVHPVSLDGLRPGMDLQASGFQILNFTVDVVDDGFLFTAAVLDPFREARTWNFEDLTLQATGHTIPLHRWTEPGYVYTGGHLVHCHCYDASQTFTWFWNTTSIDGSYDVLLDLRPHGINATASAFVDTRGYAEGITTDGIVAVGSIHEATPAPVGLLPLLALALLRRRD